MKDLKKPDLNDLVNLEEQEAQSDREFINFMISQAVISPKPLPDLSDEQMASLAEEVARFSGFLPDGFTTEGLPPQEVFHLLRDNVRSYLESLQVKWDYGSLVPPIVQLAQTVQENWLTSGLRQSTLNLVDNMNSTFAESLSKLLAPLTEMQRQIADACREFARLVPNWVVEYAQDDAFVKSGWWAIPTLPTSLRATALECYRETGERGLSKTLLRYYRTNGCAELKATIESWMDQPGFLLRQKIVRQALGAHVRGQYFLTVPVLFAQVESLCLEAIAWIPKLKNKNRLRKEHVERLCEVLYAASNVSPRGFMEQTAATFDGGELRRREATIGVFRDEVLHGQCLDYGTQLNSLKLFLMLDTLHYLLGRFLEENDGADAK